MAQVIELWTDGACSGNPGPGGWAAILVAGQARKELSGGDPDTTNNRMELQAVIGGLAALRRPAAVCVHTDSAYVLKAVTEGWLANWQQRGWKTKAGKPVANQDLWLELQALLGRHQVSWRKIQGHSGVYYNERCDALAVAASQAAARRS